MRRRKYDNDFGTSVSQALAEARLNQTDLAQQTNTSVSYVNQLITGRKTPSPEWVDFIASTLKLQGARRTNLHRAAAKQAGYDIDLTK